MRLWIPNTNGEKLAADIENEGDACVVLCHGFGGHKNNGIVSLLFDTLTAEGIPVCRFDFAGSGESEGTFSEGTFLKAPTDLRAVIDFLAGRGFKKFITIGHSMGGSACLLEAWEDPRVKAVVPIAAPVRSEKTWEMNKSWIFPGSVLTPPRIPGVSIDREYRITQEWIDAAHEAKVNGLRQGCNVLAIYGLRDESVPVEDGLLLKEWGAAFVTFETDHSFWSVRERVAKAVLGFLREQLTF